MQKYAKQWNLLSILKINKHPDKGFVDWFFNQIIGKKEALAAHRLPNFKNHYGMGYDIICHPQTNIFKSLDTQRYSEKSYRSCQTID